jgi:diamine N-acetyltransferase
MGEELLQNDTIRLRPLEPEDLSLLYTIENDTSLWSVGCQNVPYSRYALHRYIAENKNDLFADREVRLMMETCTGGEAVGLIDLFEFDPMHRRAQVGVVVLEKYRGRGMASQALELLKAYARRLRMHQLYAYVSCENAESLRLFRNRGFGTESLLKEWVYTGSGYVDVLLLQCFL